MLRLSRRDEARNGTPATVVLIGHGQALAHNREQSMGGTLMGDRMLGPLVSKWSGHVLSMSM